MQKYLDHIAIPSKIIGSKKLSSTDRKVYAILKYDEESSFYTSPKTIEEVTKLSEVEVYKSIRHLQELKLITLKYQSKKPYVKVIKNATIKNGYESVWDLHNDN